MLVGFLVLSLVSAVVISIAWNTLRVEAWQTEQIEKIRLDYLARTAAKAVTDELTADPDNFGILNRNGIVSQPKVITDGTFSATVEITIKGDDQRANVVAKASSAKGGSGSGKNYDRPDDDTQDSHMERGKLKRGTEGSSLR